MLKVERRQDTQPSTLGPQPFTMSTPAKVHSSEAIEAVRLALMAFVQQVGDALTELSAEMRRMQEWLDHDRPRHWKMQVRRAVDGAHEAQQALHRCIMFPIANERPSCTEERAALKRARARLAYCEEKEDKVRKWQQTMRHEMFEYEGRISQLVRLVEIDVPRQKELHQFGRLVQLGVDKENVADWLE